MQTFTAAQLAPLLNSYSISPGPPRAILVPKASQVANLQDITVTGQLLKKQFLAIVPGTNRRTSTLAANGGLYVVNTSDGDLHFSLGVKQLTPHIACELQNAKAWVAMFNRSVGMKISVSGFLRCLFEHPGFAVNDDAHIFEIHPVRAVAFGGPIQSFNVDIPEQKSIHTWTSPHPLNDQDGRIRVKYDPAQDTLTFTGMDGKDENYVRVGGSVSKVKLHTDGSAPASFTLTSQEIGHAIQVFCLQGTTAARQLRQLAATRITLIALRNIDLAQALKNRYVINLLAIDIQPA